MPVDLALAAILLLTPLVRHFVEERCVDKAVKLVEHTQRECDPEGISTHIVHDGVGAA